MVISFSSATLSGGFLLPRPGVFVGDRFDARDAVMLGGCLDAPDELPAGGAYVVDVSGCSPFGAWLTSFRPGVFA